jgi:hypothetical protein
MATEKTYLDIPYQLVLRNRVNNEANIILGGVSYPKQKAERMRDIFKLIWDTAESEVEIQPINVSLN